MYYSDTSQLGVKSNHGGVGAFMFNNIAGERARLGLSQEQLAEKLNIKDRKTIMRWESDPMGITGENLCKLSNLFGCSIEYILGLTEERVPKN